LKPREILQSDVDELLFEGRNKSYGAYQLRTIYWKHVLYGIGVTVVVSLLIILIPLIIKLFQKDISIDQNEIVQVSLPPPSAVVLPEYVPPPPPAPARNTPPKIVKDTLQQKNKEEPKKEEKKEVASDTKTDSTAKVTQNSGAGSGGGGEEGDNGLYKYADVPPSFPGGSAAMVKFIQAHIVYPPAEAQQLIGGLVWVSVIVNKDGTLSDIKIATSVNKNLDAEALRVVKLLPPFNPGMLNHHPIRIITKIPVRFVPR
jgi:protein TonB